MSFLLQDISPLLSSVLAKTSSLEASVSSTISIFSSFLDTLELVAEAAVKTKGMMITNVNPPGSIGPQSILG